MVQSASRYDFREVEVFNPEPHVIMREVIEYATTKTHELFNGVELPKIDFELIPLGSGRGIGANVKAVIDPSLAEEELMGDLDLGIIFHEPWPHKLAKNFVISEVYRFCEEKSSTHYRYFCEQFNLYNCNVFTSGNQLAQKVYIVFSAINDHRYKNTMLMDDYQYYQLFSLCLPFLSRDLVTRMNYIQELSRVLNDRDIRDLFTEQVQFLWSQTFRNVVLPGIKHFYNDPAFRREFVTQLGLHFL